MTDLERAQCFLESHLFKHDVDTLAMLFAAVRKTERERCEAIARTYGLGHAPTAVCIGIAEAIKNSD